MGHIAQLTNQFKSINTFEQRYDISKTFSPLHPRMLCAKFVNVFSLFHYYLPLEIGLALHLNKLKSPSTKDALVEIGPVVLEKIFKFCQHIFVIISPWESTGPFI